MEEFDLCKIYEYYMEENKLAESFWGRSIPCSNVGGFEYGKLYCKLGLPCGPECMKCDKYAPDPEYNDLDMVKAALIILEAIHGSRQPNLYKQN
jgi:hypothetical protein